MSVSCLALTNYLHTLLKVQNITDYCPNGLQVQGAATISTIVTGVTACQALLDIACSKQAQAVIVHHGYFWKGESPCITGIKAKRLATLLGHDINLLAYHLPLDLHPTLGNNAMLANLFNWQITGFISIDNGLDLLPYTILPKAITAAALQALLREKLGQTPLHIPTNADHKIERIAWCTGAAQNFIEYAANAGMDAYISGEISEPTVHSARENNVHYFAGGHHATERFGIKALTEHLKKHFTDLTIEFVDIGNPV